MTVAGAIATCEACGVTVRYAPGFDPPEGSPRGWADGTCLACRRAGIVGGNERAEFELRLGRGVHEAANAANLSKARVRKIAERLLRAGEISPPESRAVRRRKEAAAARAATRKRRAEEERDAALATLRKLGNASSGEFADTAGVSKAVAKRRLRRLVEAGRAVREDRRLGRRGGRRVTYRVAC